MIQKFLNYIFFVFNFHLTDTKKLLWILCFRTDFLSYCLCSSDTVIQQIYTKTTNDIIYCNLQSMFKTNRMKLVVLHGYKIKYFLYFPVCVCMFPWLLLHCMRVWYPIARQSSSSRGRGVACVFQEGALPRSPCTVLLMPHGKHGWCENFFLETGLRA